MKTLFVLALLLLVFGPGAASAECAWVLWEGRSPQIGRTTWTVWLAFQTQAQCEAHRQVILKNPMTGMTPALLNCLPDTVDPRGPKGSGR